MEAALLAEDQSGDDVALASQGNADVGDQIGRNEEAGGLRGRSSARGREGPLAVQNQQPTTSNNASIDTLRPQLSSESHDIHNPLL